MLNCIINPKSGNITMFIAGEMKIINKEHVNYNEICKAISASDEASLKTLINSSSKLMFNNKPIEVTENASVFIDGKSVHTTIAKRIIEFIKNGLPHEPLQRFLENCEKNPNPQSVEELYDFLENRGIPITEDGCFLAYKAVRHDFKDKYTGKIDNSVGKIVEFELSQVDPDRRRQCSFGLHVGALEYVSGYGSGHDDVWLLCKINPIDAVAVPLDHNAQKIRVRKYQILEVISKDLREQKTDVCYTPDGKKISYEEYKEFMWKLDEENKTALQKEKERLMSEHTRESITSHALNLGVFASIEEIKNLSKEEICLMIAQMDMV